MRATERRASSPSKEQSHPQRRKRSGTSRLWTLTSQLLGLSWLAPIITLLVLHFTNHIIGASAWCPNGKCSVDPLGNMGENAIQRAQELDGHDHNTLGGLQFVAKALEVWFVFIATSLVYNVTIMMASRSNGLPVGFLMTHVEFTDLRMLINKILWTTPTSPTRSTSRRRLSTVKLYLFAIFAAVMCILANLMGPSTAVLVLPTLQWVDTPIQMEQRFNTTGLANGPMGNSVFNNCSDAMLTARNYSCNSDEHAGSLDSLITSVTGITQQVFRNLYGYTGGNAIVQEMGVTFAFNITEESNFLTWVPNRQVLRNLSNDLGVFFNITQGQPTNEAFAQPYNNSLQTVLKRQGPIIGVKGNLYFPRNFTVTQVAHDKQIHCFLGYTPSYYAKKTYTKCIRVGPGWNSANANASFAISDAKSSNHTADVDIYFSDEATYFNSTVDLISDPDVFGMDQCRPTRLATGTRCSPFPIFLTV